MSKVLAVFGATGQQGSSVINHVLQDPHLSQQFTLRALTRDPASEKAQQLAAKGVSVVAADVLDASSLAQALHGAHTVFAMTTPMVGPGLPEGDAALEWEFDNAKRIADVALAAGVAYFVFSTLPSVRDLSGGKYTAVTPFDAKAKAEAYIRGLGPKMASAFFCPAYFMENFQAQPWLSPQRDAQGVCTLARPNPPGFRMALIAAVDDCGKFVGRILASPEKYAGSRFCAAEGLYSWDEIAAALGRSVGEKVVYKQIGYEEWKDMFPFGKKLFEEGFRYGEEFGDTLGRRRRRLRGR
ncbi:hypothetical protein N0V90_010660 [Kalmusia sp. IMI 367209]|nr:hypothetical protein N0V90_010660 [Kalmusia sp. IMI 367209]